MLTIVGERDVSRVLQDFLSVLPVYKIPQINLLGRERLSGYVYSIPFFFKYPEEYNGKFGEFISNIEERLEYTGEYKTAYFQQLTKEELSIPEIFIEQIRTNSGISISEFDDFCIRIIKVPPVEYWEHSMNIVIFPANGIAYGAILPYSPKYSLEYYSENIIRDLVRSPYKLVTTSDIRKNNIGSDHYSYMYTGLLSERGPLC